MTCVEWASFINDIVTAIATVIATSLAAVGLNSWRRELKGRAEFETARAHARATYRLRDAIMNCRSPFVSGQEFPVGYGGALGGHTTKDEGDAWRHIHVNRWVPVAEAIREFNAQSLESESIWGEPIKAKSIELLRCAQTLNAAMEAFISDKYAGGAHFTSNPEFGIQIRSEIQASSTDKTNKLTVRILNAVDDIDEFLRPHLRRD